MSESIRQSNLFVAEDYKKVFKAYSFIDYTAYDFDTLKQALINYIRVYYPEDFNDYIESSEFIAIIELLAYFGTSLAFRTDLNSRENFIDTAERRESIIRLAQMVNYVPRRNVPASGLFKISAVQTNQPLTDANGVDINDLTIFWNDPNNPDWFDQFVQICNSSFSSLNPFGRPTKSGTIGSIPTDLYQLNNVLGLTVTYPTAISINGQQYPIDVCNPDFEDSQSIFERDPDPANAFNLIYRNDSLGVSSANTGFFLYFKQGNLINIDTNFDFPVPNRVFPINIQDINQDDVYVQETDKNGNVIAKWVKVPALAGENIIYNSITYSERNIFDVISDADDTIKIRFADGNFGNVPTGLFRTWVRVSANEDLVIRANSAQGLQITIPYIGANQQQYTLKVTFNLEQTVGNAAASETDEQIKLRAPEVFSTQSRMVNGSDYNVLPLIYGNQIAKLKALNRTYSGQSRYLDLNDPTGFHKDLTIFGQDGALYRDNENVLIEVQKDSANINSIESILILNIQEALRDSKVASFFNDEYLPQFESAIRVNIDAVTKPDGYSLLDLNNNSGYESPLFWRTSPTKFKNDTGYFTTHKNVNAVPILSITSIGTAATLTTTTPHKLTTGRSVVISGVLPTTYNGTYTIIVNSPVSFKFTTVSPPATAATILGSYTIVEDFAILENIFTTSNIPTGTYQPWGFIKSGAVVSFANSTLTANGWEYDNATLSNTPVITVVQNGQPTIATPYAPYANVGPIELGKEIQNYYQAIKVYPAFRNKLTDTEIAAITKTITDGVSFWLYYDLLSDTWATSTRSTSGISRVDRPFVYAPTNIGEIYSDWERYPDSGILYVTIARDNQLNTTTYEIAARGRVFVFESYKDVRFYWKPGQVVIDNTTGQALQDIVQIMPFVNTNYTVNNNAPVITADSYLKNPVDFNISGVFIQDDGFLDSSKVKVSLVDNNYDGIADDPDGFGKVVNSQDRVVFEYYSNEVAGYQSSRPWVATWSAGSGSLENCTGDVYVYFPVDPTNLYALWGSPYISSMPVTDIYNPELTVGATVIYMDKYDLLFINNASQLDYSEDPAPAPSFGPIYSIANQVTAFFNSTTTYPHITGAGSVENKIDIVKTYFINKSFLLAADSPPGYGIFKSLNFLKTANTPAYPTGQTITSASDTLHYDKNGKVFTQNKSVPIDSQIPLYFKWDHKSPTDQRVDPSPSNIIDMIVITNGYYRDMLIWKNVNGSLLSLPAAPTTETLRMQFQNLDNYKMVSDSIVWNSGEFKVLFGTQAATELQATFKVVKSPASNVSDNEVKTRVIQAIDTYFDIRNWDFGEKFFYTELAAYIHQQLSRIISSVVIVPNNASSQFGNLFEIIASPTQLFISTATVNNVQIVSNLTDQNLRV